MSEERLPRYAVSIHRWRVRPYMVVDHEHILNGEIVPTEVALFDTEQEAIDHAASLNRVAK